MASATRIVEWLDHHGALRLGGSPWRTLGEEEDIFRIDWGKLFPNRLPAVASRDGPEPDVAEMFDDLSVLVEDQVAPGEARRLSRGVNDAILAGRPRDEEGPTCVAEVGWDTAAWYQPMHFFGHDWGIFIRRECVLHSAIWVARFLPTGSAAYSPSVNLLAVLIRAGFAALFLHEQFHHKVESLGIRLHVVEMATRYLPYTDSVYQATYGSDDNLEEALANADAFSRVMTKPYATWLGDRVTKALRSYMHWRFQFDPPGYRRAVHYLNKPTLSRGINSLQGQVQEAVLNPNRTSTDWQIAPRLHQSLFTIADHIWEVVPKHYARSFLPPYTFPATMSSREMIRLAEQNGWNIEPGAGKGSHIRMKKPGFRPLTIPGDRRDLSPTVLSNNLKVIGNFRIRDIPRLRENL